MLLPWVVAMALETIVEMINLVYLFYLQTVSTHVLLCCDNIFIESSLFFYTLL